MEMTYQGFIGDALREIESRQITYPLRERLPQLIRMVVIWATRSRNADSISTFI
jgi:hypothetical protein